MTKTPAGITTIIKDNASDGISHQKPVGFSVLNHNDRVEVRVRPPFEIFILFFTCFWYGFLAIWYTIVFNTGQVFMGLFALIHVFAGLFMLRKTFYMIFGRTHLIVDESGLTLKRKPSLKDNSIHVRPEALDQFYVTQSKKGFNLLLQTNEVTHITLLSGVKTYEHAHFVEKFLEKQLEIQNRKVEGEHRTN